MSALTTSTAAANRSTAATVSGKAPAARATRRRSPLEWVRAHVLATTSVLIFVFLLAPNVVMLVMSFNSPIGKYNYIWHQFSTDAWRHPCAVGDICQHMGLSLEIGVVAMIGSTVLGTMAAFAMSRHRFRARPAVNVLLFLPMAAPEIIMGATLLTLFFSTIGSGSMGFWTIVIGHIMFCLSYVVVTVKSRLAGMDPTLEKAAQDLYATPRQTFMKVTLPLVAPGILAAALLSFALSVDDYIVTKYTAGDQITFPLYVYGAVQRSVPTQIDVIGSMMMLVTMTGIAGMLVVGRLRARRR
ncbi:MAG TPA: ABC transporter permease [Actinocrinis sp.]|uniref:ABC transporter permease n=1 Tax=Actinocrinis sp. TaxID=1920516 RepID=UPI002D2D6EF2|nr:ABC transporter permease [Actinocrinis sp.]HZU57798.1 ABC transporter permease [Actinocrinis sp.]